MSQPATIPNPPEEEEKSFLEKHRGLAIIAVLLLAVGLVVFVQKKLSGGGASVRKGPELVSVRLPPPPPTPPPPQSTPPPQEMKREEKMIDQTPVNENEEKPKDEPAPAPDISTGIKGDGGSDGFGVGGSGNGQIGGSGSGRSGSKWGWYAAQVTGSIKDAIARNAKTRIAKLNIKVRVWPDATGRISRVKAESTNDPALDRAINEALTGLQLKEPMPEGMPAPIVLRISAQR